MAQEIANTFVGVAGSLIGVVIGGFLTFYIQRAQHNVARKEKRVAVARAIAAELNAYLDLMTMRAHSDSVRGLVQRLQAGEDISLKNLPTNDKSVPETFPVFFSQLTELGLLHEFACDLAKFYSQIAGVFATLKMMHAGEFDKRAPIDRATVVQEELDLWENSLKLARWLSDKLNTVEE